MDLILRDLLPDEQQFVCAWAQAEHWPGLVKGSTLTREEFPNILHLPGHMSFAVSLQGLPAFGFGQIWCAPNGRANLVRILVDPAMRGQGLGRRLCALLLEQALLLPKVTEVFLRVRRDNAPAVAVYRSLGFREIQEESNPDVLAMVYGD
ncbi:GNAT family N-acetyltransferase [Paucibacter sp. AS339]|uniref:GNAT family N-acetyltransferase n=1 Tax=Paucibacter hankyongi TaxID=3133434 RepID=UPI0030B75E86